MTFFKIIMFVSLGAIIYTVGEMTGYIKAKERSKKTIDAKGDSEK